MKAPPTVSVVLPTFNRAGQLARSIGSVLAQSFTDLELIVVDDGSMDETRDVVAALRDPRVRYLARPNGGVAEARNSGVAEATGVYLAFQDSDDEWLLDKLKLQLADLATRARSMSVCGVLRIVGSGTGTPALLTYPRRATDWDGGLDHHGVLAAAVAYTQSWLVPREAVLAAGGFDPRFCVWDDWDLLIRLSERLAIVPHPAPLVVSTRGADSLSRDPGRFARDLPLILAKYSTALAARPRAHAALRYQLASWLYRAGRLAEARDALLEAIRLRKGYLAAWKLLARTAVRQWR